MEMALDGASCPAAVPRVTDEALRLAAVRRYEILDSPPEADFDRVTALAADLFDAPVSVIGFVDHDRVWFKSHHGLTATEVRRKAGGMPILRSVELLTQTGTGAGVRSFTSLPAADDDGLQGQAFACPGCRRPLLMHTRKEPPTAGPFAPWDHLYPKG